MKGQNQPNEMVRSKLNFWHIIFCMEDRAYMMVKIFEFCALVPEILSPKHHEIQDFGQNYHTSDLCIHIYN
jgi:hypothetical protein